MTQDSTSHVNPRQLRDGGPRNALVKQTHFSTLSALSMLPRTRIRYKRMDTSDIEGSNQPELLRSPDLELREVTYLRREEFLGVELRRVNALAST